MKIIGLSKIFIFYRYQVVYKSAQHRYLFKQESFFLLILLLEIAAISSKIY